MNLYNMIKEVIILKRLLKKLCEVVCLLLIFYLLGLVDVGYYFLAPLGISVVFAMMVLNCKTVLTSVCYFVGNSMAQYTLNGLYISLTVVGVVLITRTLLKRCKWKISRPLGILPMTLSMSTYILLNIGQIKQNLALCLSVVLAILFYFVCVNFISAFLMRGNSLNLDEKICASTFLIVISMGLAEINIFQFSTLKFVAIFSILIATYSFQSGTVFLLASLYGVGYAIVNIDISMIAVYVGFSLVSLAFKTNYRIFSCIAVVLLDVLYGVFLNLYTPFTFMWITSTIFACVLYIAIPKRVLNVFKDTFAFKKDIVGVRSLVNRTKAGICKKMNELSQVFQEMNIVFRSMVRGVLNEEGANLLLTQELINKTCLNCPERNKCMRNDNTKDTISSLITCGFERGKVTLLDVPQMLTSKCGRINFMVSSINESLKSYKNYTHLVGNMDASRILIADQLSGVSTILKNLGEEIRLNIAFDLEKEQRIIEELTYKNIMCYEAIVYEENVASKSVSLLLKNEPINKDVLEKAVSHACKMKMSIISKDISSVPNSIAIFLKNSPNYDLVFGSASVSKNGRFKNGDAHSLIKIDNGKYILSLCDGIGSGEKAQKISNLSISLIENFYKAGFDNDTILNSINKLLSLNNEENFSSVDLCVMDFHNNVLDFIKLGASYGFVKNINGTDIIESSGLPIGVLEEMRPHITRRHIDAFDIIVLVSDGISDAFDNKSDLQDYINGLSSTNPQTIADEIMDRAKDLNNGVVKDDMTVLVVRIFPI